MKKQIYLLKNYIKTLLFLILLSFLTNSCKNEKHKIEEADKKNFVNKESETPEFPLGNDSIISYTVYNNADDEPCKNWTVINKDQILGLLQDFVEFDSYEWNLCFGTFECGARGELVHNKTLYKYNLNAGGWISLSDKNGQKFLGSINKKDTLNYFISVYYCDEDWD